MPRHGLNTTPPWRAVAGIAVAAAGVLGGAATAGSRASARPAVAAVPADAAALFAPTRVWNVHLTLTAEAWAAMEPRMVGPGGAPGMPFGMPGAPPGGAPGPQAGPPMPGPTPSMLLAPLIVGRRGPDWDGRISADEFRTLAGRWWTAWDRRGAGSLTAADVLEGLRTAFTDGPAADAGESLGPPGRRGIPFETVHARMEFEGRAFADVGLRYKGNNTYMVSQGQLKRPLKIDLNHYVKGQRLAGITTLNLHNNVNDPGCMNECLAYRAFRDAGVPAPRTAYARVYLTVPGVHSHRYVGLYTLVEDVNKDFAEVNFGTRQGVIYKPVTPWLFGYLGQDWRRYRQVYDPRPEPALALQQRLIDFCRFVTSADDATFAARAGDYIDLDECAAYLAAAVCILDQDSLLDMGQNLYLHLDPRLQKLAFIPWDQDHSWGQFPLSGTQEDREQLSIVRPWMGSKPFLERLFAAEPFRRRYLAKVRQIAADLLRPERIAVQVDEVAAAIRPAVRDESSAMLARFDRSAAGLPVLPGGPPGGGPDIGPPGMGGIKPIKPFVKARAASLAAQLAGESAGWAPRLAPGMPGGGPGGPPGDPGGPGADFGPWSLLAPSLMTQLDPASHGRVTREEFMEAFDRWFASWSVSSSTSLTLQELQSGLDRTFSLTMPGSPGFLGPPPFGGGSDD